jgi:alpha-1,2-mannosyltransferase
MPYVFRSSLAVIRREPWAYLLGLTVFLAIGGRVAWDHLHREPGLWMIDLEVYREAGVSVLRGRDVYDWLTPLPQLLLFTYPPFAALVAIPLAWLPFHTVGWLWTAVQMIVLLGIVAVVYRPLLARFGTRAPIVLGAVAGLLLWMSPLSDGIRFGQVGLVIVGLCAADYLTKRPRWPRGLLVGLATAIKLTPGVFIIHMWLSGRRREALTATATAIGVTLATFLVLPAASATYWFDAVLDSDRVGNNAGTSNQSIRGILLRFHVDSGFVWLPLIAVTAWFGFRAAVRTAKAGDDLAACAIVGLLSVVLAPVAWIHHLGWIVLALAVVLRDGSHLRRVALAVGIWYFFFIDLPWRGWAMTVPSYEPHLPIFVARLIQGSFGLAALALIPLLLHFAERDRQFAAAKPGPPSTPIPRQAELGPTATEPASLLSRRAYNSPP